MRRIGFTMVALIVAAGSGRAQRPTAPAWTLVEDLRIGEEEGPKSFADLRSVAVTKNGNIFVLDFKAREIRLFDSKGNFLRQLSRDGAGPGEIRNANGLAVGESDIVWVNDPSNSRFTLFKSDGSFHKQVLVPINRYGYMWEAAIDSRGRAIDVISIPMAPDAATGTPRASSRLRLVDESGKADTVDMPSCKGDIPLPNPPFLVFKGERGGMNMTLPFLASGQVLVTSTGHAWCTPSSEYRLWSGALGAPNKEVVSIKVRPLHVTEAERKKSLDRIDSITRNGLKLTSGDPSLIPKTKPVIARIHSDPAGRVWVRLSETPEATPAFDLFDASGKAVARVQSKGKVSLYQTWITDTHLYTVVLDDDDVQALVRYRIAK